MCQINNNTWSVDDYSNSTPYTEYGLRKMKERVVKTLEESNLSEIDKNFIIRTFDIISQRG